MAEIDFDGKTVWVNDETGCCIGRFAKFGIDVHKTGPEQMRTGMQCLACMHAGGSDLASWQAFRALMAQHHGVDVPEEARPKFITG